MTEQTDKFIAKHALVGMAEMLAHNIRTLPGAISPFERKLLIDKTIKLHEYIGHALEAAKKMADAR